MILDEKFFSRFGVEYKPNEIIFCEFEPGNEFYFIQSGRVKIVKLINNRGEDVTNVPGETATVFVRGEQIMQGYFKDPDATKSVLDDEGWLRTGDAGRLSLTGELQIIGKWGRRG